MLKLTTSKVLLLLVINIFINRISSQNYCNIGSCPNKFHTMCRYDSPEPHGSCGPKTAIKVGLEDGQKEEILNLINELRAYVAEGKEHRGFYGPQPAATNLEPLTWDDELAEIAQRWANQCNVKHDHCRNVERFAVGQNYASETSLTDYPNNMTSLIWGWYNEVVASDRNEVNKLSEMTHWAQLVWADSKYIGCGAINYIKYVTVYTTYLVCNFGPGGNLIGRPIYKVY